MKLQVKNMDVSVIVPVFNEQSVLDACLASLEQQTYKNIEIILVDDASTDNSLKIARKYKVKILTQDHRGPGVARNLGVARSRGDIIVFVDADMEFDKDFIKNLVEPIVKGDTIGTFSKEEYVKNKTNPISICWNINRGLPPDRMISEDFPDRAQVFRAILKKEFNSVEGFDTDGQYIDDWSLSKKLGVQSTAASGAVYYHTNPGTIPEVWLQAKWIGKNDFIAGNLGRIIRSLVVYSLPVSLMVGTYKSLKYKYPFFLVFKLIYDLAITIAILQRIIGVKRMK